MKPNQLCLLLHPVFLASLLLMLVNDHYWKYEYHNVLTGKLSDITGLVVLPLFLTALFPKLRLHVFILSAVFFIWWKSGWSQPFIDWVNNDLGWGIGRIIDPTDLAGLVILPLAWRIKAKEWIIPLRIRQLVMTSSAVLTIMTLCSTTIMRHAMVDKTVNTHGSFQSKAFRIDIIDAFSEHGIDVYRDTAYYREMREDNIYQGKVDSSGKLQLTKSSNLYARREPYHPTFTIPTLTVENDTLHDVRFQVEEQRAGRASIIRLVSFRYDKIPDSVYFYAFVKYEKKFRKPLLARIKQVLK